MNTCYCCLLRLPKFELKTPYIRRGVTEIFSEMIEECFKIRLFPDSEDDGICEVCVGRLRDAIDFKLQVQGSQAKMQSRLERLHVNDKYKEPVVNLQIPDGAEEVMNKRDISITMLEPKSELPASSTLPVSTRDNIGARSEESKCDSFEDQFTMFCLNSDKHTRPKPKRRETKRSYSCEKCPAELSTKALLIDHKRTHKTKDRTCHICSKKFKKKYRLRDHLRSHDGQKPFSCDMCRKYFSSSNTLWKHKLIHKEVAFICDYCGKKYTRRANLVAHIIAHSENSPCKCEVCGLQLINKYALGKHKAVHSQIKNFSCNDCGRQFRRKDHLETHNLIHSGQKPYSCGICEQRFTTKTNVKRHKVKVHAQKT